jgi:glycosyltransferase involved in cell wall biosynthesis
MVSDIKVSAVVITKDEERNIHGCISSIIDSIDELIIYDTGSSDSTMSLALNYPSNKILTYQGSWSDSFSKARNSAIDCCNNEWIIFIDADERLISDPYNSVRDSILRYLVNTENYSLGCPKIISESRTTHSLTRVLPNNGKHRFHGRVHEYIESHSSTVKKLPITFTHTGYDKSTTRFQCKSERNLKLLTMQQGEEPHNARWLYYYLLYENNHTPVSERIEQSKQLASSELTPDIYSHAAYSLLISLLLNNNEIDRVLDEALECLNRHKNHFDAQFFQILQLFERNRRREFEENIEEFLASNEPEETSFLTKKICKEIASSIEI